MAVLKTEAVVLDRIDYSNTSLIVTFYSHLFGRLSAIAKGARRPKSPFLGTLDLLNQNEIVFYRHTRSSLHTLTESHVRDNFPGIRKDLPRSYAAIYMAELVKEMTREEEHQPEIFNLLVAALRELSSGRKFERILFQFEIQLLSLTGFLPELARCVSCAGRPGRGRLFFSSGSGGIVCASCAATASEKDLGPTSQGAVATLRALQRKTITQGRTVGVSPSVARDIRGLLRPYIVSRLEKEPRSLRFL